jgi:carboxyl-terminal processing protease
MKKIIIAVLVSIIVVVFTFSTGLWLGISFEPFKRYISNIFRESAAKYVPEEAEGEFSVEPFNETIDLVSNYALEEKSKEELLKAAIKSMLAELDDEYTEYFTVEEYEMIMESYSGTMSGIGVVVTVNDKGQVVVVMPLEGTPAYRAGIKEGDIITEVNGVDIKDMALEKVVAMIKGEAGTRVDLKIYIPEDDDTVELTITRAKFYIPNLTSDQLEGNIGYIWYYTFQDKGAQQLDDEVQKLIDGGAEGIILDLRYNLGGVLTDAVEVCDLFLNEGVITTVKGRSGDKEITDEYIASEGKYTEIPLVVLINGFSASASELTAGALKDNDRAILIGEQSHGKGVVQVLYELSDGSGIKFTTARFFLPSGISIQGTGIEPDILVELELDSKEDLQLSRAVEEMEILLNKG